MEADQQADPPPDECDHRIQNAEIEQPHDDNEAVGPDSGFEKPALGRRQAHQYFRPVEGRDGNQVQGGQGEVDLHHEIDQDEEHARIGFGHQFE